MNTSTRQQRQQTYKVSCPMNKLLQGNHQQKQRSVDITTIISIKRDF